MENKIGDRNRSTLCVYILLVVVSLFLVSQMFCLSVKKLILQQFHLRQESFITFAAVHFIPPMYNFANEVWYSQAQVEFEEIEKSIANSSKTMHLWINHYPLRVVTFGWFRPMYFEHNGPQYMYVRSRFMEVTMKTVYQLKKSADGIEILIIEKAIEE